MFLFRCIGPGYFNVIFLRLEFCADYDAEAGGEVLFNENDVETVCLLSNRKPDSYVHLNLKMEDYYRIKDAEKEQGKK